MKIKVSKVVSKIRRISFSFATVVFVTLLCKRSFLTSADQFFNPKISTSSAAQRHFPVRGNEVEKGKFQDTKLHYPLVGCSISKSMDGTIVWEFKYCLTPNIETELRQISISKLEAFGVSGKPVCKMRLRRGGIQTSSTWKMGEVPMNMDGYCDLLSDGDYVLDFVAGVAGSRIFFVRNGDVYLETNICRKSEIDKTK